MNAWHNGLWLIAGLLFVGCQSNGDYDLMERELRLQEDRIFQLEDELDRHCKLLKACQEENRTLKDSQDNGASRLRLSAPKTLANGSAPLTPPKVEIDLPGVGGASPGLSSPVINSSQPAPNDGLPSLQTPQLNAPRGIDRLTPPPTPDERPVPRSLLERSGQSWQQVPESESQPIEEQRPPATQTRRPSWSPYR